MGYTIVSRSSPCRLVPHPAEYVESHGMRIAHTQELLHHVVAEVVKSGAPKPGKRGNKGPRAHLIPFLVQMCSTLPDYVLVFAKVIGSGAFSFC